MGALFADWVAQMSQIPHTQIEHIESNGGMVVLRLVQQPIRPLQALAILTTLRVHSATRIEWHGPDFIIVRWRLFDGLLP